MTSTTITVPSGQYVFASSGVTLTNASTISDTVAVSSNFSYDTLVNLGMVTASSTAVTMAAGGSVTNASGGVITGGAGAYFYGGTGTVANSGSIVAASGNGIALFAGGVVTNTAGLIEGGNGIGVASAAGSVTNSGTIIGTTRQGVGLGDGGSVANDGLISGIVGVYVGAAAGTVTNTDTILGSSSYGVTLHNGGVVTNSAGLIQGTDGVVIAGTPNMAGTINNAGTIIGTSGEGAWLREGGSLGNTGLIEGGARISFGYAATNTVANSGTILATFDGVQIDNGGTLINSAGLIQGYTGADISGGSGFVSNAATIIGASQDGIVFSDGGTIVNRAGLIQGVTYGAFITFGSSTLENAGTISGGIDAVKIKAGFNDLLIVDPGASFVGTVDGGNTVGATAATTLALASGASEGTLTSLGSQFIDFTQIVVDAGAYWSLQHQTIGSGVTLTNAGTIGSNVLLAAGAVLSNVSSGVINAGTAMYAVYGTGTATVVNLGGITGSTYGAISLANGGLLSNASGGVIIGGAVGVDLAGPLADTVVNGGSIIATVNFAVQANAAQSQVTNQSGGLIHGNSFGVIAAGDASVSNAGSIYGGYSGVLLRGSGLVTNQSGGTITGGSNGVDVHYAPDTVVNAGRIGGGKLAVKFGAYNGSRLIVEPGASFSGQVEGGNTIGSTAASTLELASSTAAGTLSGLGAGIDDFAHVTIDAGATWTLTAAALPAGYSIIDSGTLTNAGSLGSAVTVTSGASLSNASSGTVLLDGSAVIGPSDATVVNAGGIASNDDDGVALGDDSLLINQVGGSIRGGFGGVYTSDAPSTTIGNYGQINGTGFGVLFQNGGGGSITNWSGGTIASGLAAIVVDGGVSTVANAGSLYGAGYYGIGFRGGSTDFLNNQMGGVITGPDGVQFKENSLGTIVNAGSIGGTSDGIDFISGGGTVTNLSGGTISGGTIGVFMHEGTLLNAGVVTGGAGAVHFDAVSGNRLIVDPGATFSGLVDGGNTIGSTAVSTLELAPGASAGTLAGLGTSIVNFADINVDAGASWQVTGATLGAGYGIDVTGTLVNQTGNLGSVVTLATGASFTNQVGATVSSGTLANAHQGVVYGSGAGVTIINSGAIVDTGTAGQGIALHGGMVTNEAGATITGKSVGVFVTAASAIVTNSGSIFGGINNGVALYDGGTITNLAGLIRGTNAVGIAGTPGFVSNAGTMIGTSRQGVGLGAGGSVYNSGLIEGVTGVYIGGGAGTLTNAGRISASSDAVFLAPGHADRLFIDPGATFTGVVDGGNKIGAAVASTIELASGASIGTLSSVGSQYIDFAQFALDAGASWSLDSKSTIVGGQSIAFGGSGIYLHLNAPDAVAGHLTNFAAGDTIDLKGVNPASVSYSAGTLSFTGGAFELSLGGGGTLVTTASADGTALGVLCFCAGTMILTPSGERRVQDLAVGDLVTTANGVRRPIVWIGSGKVLATRGKRCAATPVIVRKDAIKPGVPSRDLHVTKGHSLFIDDVLIPVEFLVNHRSIVWDDRAQEVELYHVELEEHDVLIADGTPAESYRDDGNRWLFHNSNADWHLPPKPPCAPVLTGGRVVDAIWRRLLERCAPRGRAWLTNDPDLHLLVNGRRVDATERRGDTYIFRLTTHPCDVRICSRAAAPDELGIARDPRPLGVAIRRIVLAQADRERSISAESRSLSKGFHEFEIAGRIRWTDGDARVPRSLFAGMAGPGMLMLHLGAATNYPDEGIMRRVA